MITLLIVIAVVEALLLLWVMAKLRTGRYDGNLLVNDTDEKTTLSLEIETPPEQLIRQKNLLLKIVIEQE